MAQWYVKGLSKLTQISVQTLHHYDRIGLLQPSVRLANGYRLYSEKDLLKLQQIIALKFFGFELSQIKTLLAADINMIDHFSEQSRFLEDKAKTLLDASNALKRITSDCDRNKSIPWETIIQLIEVYRMTQALEKTWAGKVFNQKELEEYASFQQDLTTKYTENELKNFEKGWADLVSEVDANLDKDPTGDIGIVLGKRCMSWVNSFYGKKYVGLRNAIWEKGLKKGQIDHENALSSESFAWLDKAIYAYYQERIYNILDQVGSHSSDYILKLWEDLLTEMYGDEQVLKDELFRALPVVEAAMKDDKVSQVAKDWLKKIAKR